MRHDALVSQYNKAGSVPEPDVVEMPSDALAVADLALLMDMGIPPEAIRSDHTLDRDLLVEQGWAFSLTGSLSPPDTPEFHQRAQEAGARVDAKLESRRSHYSDASEPTA